MMKKSDVIMISCVAALGVFITVLIANMAMGGGPDDKSWKVQNIEVVSSDVAEPDPEVFNANAINPTVEVYIGGCADKNHNGKLDEDELAECGGSVVDTSDK